MVADAGAIIGDSFALAAVAFAYEGPMRRALAALKYRGVSRLAPILAARARPSFTRLLEISGPSVLVPVPVHPDRLRERGYNQAELLGRALAGRSPRVPVGDLLRRARPTTKQHRLNRAGRLANLREAFVLTPGTSMPRSAVLVDDIVTTSATLEACASVLRGGGVEMVYAFAIAREV